MVNVSLVLLSIAAALVSAKPSGNQDGSSVVTFVNLVKASPHRLDSLGAVGSLTRSTGSYCNGASRRYPCDGSCFQVDSAHRTWQVTGIDKNHHVLIDYFSQSDCGDAKRYIGTTDADDTTCYAHKDPNAENARSFSCVTVPILQT